MIIDLEIAFLRSMKYYSFHFIHKLLEWGKPAGSVCLLSLFAPALKKSVQATKFGKVICNHTAFLCILTPVTLDFSNKLHHINVMHNYIK